MGLPIQNLRSGTANKRPDPSTLVNGQIAINYNDDDPGIFFKDDQGALIKISPTFVGSTAPNVSPATGGHAGNSKGETWLDTSTTPASLKIFDGSSFVDSFAFADIDLTGNYAQSVIAVSGTSIDCSLGNYFTKTINGNTTLSFTQVPTSRAYSLTIELTHTSGSVTWPGSVKFPSGANLSLTAGKTSIFVFVTDDGGSRFRGAVLSNYDN